MKRREFIAGVAGAAAWPVAAQGQAEPIRRIGVLFGPEDDPQVKAQLAAFRNGLERLGWSEGRNVQIDYRFVSATIDTTQVLASELIAWQPDVIFVDSTRYTAALQQQTRTIPRSAQVSSQVWHGQAVISRDSCCTRQASRVNGLRCSRRSRPVFHASLSYTIPETFYTFVLPRL